MGDVRTHNSTMDSHRTVKLGEGVDHVTCHVFPLMKVKGQGHVTYQEQ